MKPIILKTKEIIEIRHIEIKIHCNPFHIGCWYVYNCDLSWYVSGCTVPLQCIHFQIKYRQYFYIGNYKTWESKTGGCSKIDTVYNLCRKRYME